MSKYKPEDLIKHLKEKWGGRHCPLCTVGNWEVQDSVFELRQFSGGDLVVGTGPIVPVVPVVCSNCGNTVLINALVAKLVKRPKEAQS